MNAAVTDAERDVERVAGVLARRGSLVECVAMLRGAVARNPQQDGCVRLLQEVSQGGQPTAARAGIVEIGLPLVDRWIRAGMLVEALALLSGTEMGSLETGREWAQLLGELLAPVPVDAEPVMVSMHEQLLTGGASVAMSLLEDRAKESPPPAAWAMRRLELLRWMLLDNAAFAQDAPRLPDEVPSLLAGAIREGIHQRNLPVTVESARAFVAEHPMSPDAQRTLAALEALWAEVQSRSGSAQARNRTMPVFGRPAAALQLRMCNLSNAGSVYRRLLADHADPDVAALAAHVRTVECALAGEPIDLTPVAPSTAADEGDLVEQLFGLAQTGSPRAVPEKSGPVAIADMAATEQMPSAAEHVMRLESEGRHEEAQKIRDAMASLFEDDATQPGFEDEDTDRGDVTPSAAAPRPAVAHPPSGAHPKVTDPGGVVVQKIRPIE